MISRTLAPFMLACVLAGTAPGGVISWDGSDNQPWNAPAHWVGGAVPAGGDTARIAAGRAWANLDLGISSVLVEAGGQVNVGFNIPAPCAITLGGGRIEMCPPADGSTVAGHIQLTADSIIQRDNTSCAFTFTGTIGQDSSRRKLTFLSVPDTLKGAFAGVIDLTNRNVYSGGSEILGPTVRASHASALGTGTVLVDGGRLSLNLAGAYTFDLVTMTDGSILLEKPPGSTVMDLQGGTLQNNGPSLTLDATNSIAIHNVVTILAGGANQDTPFTIGTSIGGDGTAVLNPFSPPAWDSAGGKWVYATKGRLVINAGQGWSGGTNIEGLVDLNCAGALPGGTVTVYGQDPVSLPSSQPGVLRVFKATALAANTDLVLKLTHYSYQDPATHVVTQADWRGSVYLGVAATVRSLKVDGAFMPAGTYTSASLPNYLTGTKALTVTTTVRMAGDVDGDGHVDVVDLLYLVDAFGSMKGDANYNPGCDFNSDDSVDVVDLLSMVENFGT